MEGGGFGFPFGGDPEEIMRGLREFAEQQAESVQEAQREQFATLTLNTAVELTAAALSQVQVAGGAEEQSLGADGPADRPVEAPCHQGERPGVEQHVDGCQLAPPAAVDREDGKDD